MAKQKRSTTRSGSGRLDNLFSWRRAILEATAEEVPPTRAHVLLVLSCHMNDAGDGCWPSQATLAAETKLSLRAVQEHLRLAGESGWIIRSMSFRNGRVVGTNYRAAIPSAVWARMVAAAEAPHPDDAPDAQDGDDAGDATPAETGPTADVAPPAGGVASPAGGCRTSCRGVSQEVHPNSSGNASLNASGKEREPAAPADSPNLAPAGCPESGRNPGEAQQAVQEPPPAPPPRAFPPPRPMRVTQEELDMARDTANRAAELFGKAALRATDVHRWEQLWRKAAGDLEEIAKVFRVAKRRCTAAHWELTLSYVLKNYDDLVSAAYQVVPAEGGEDPGMASNADVAARLKAGGGR